MGRHKKEIPEKEELLSFPNKNKAAEYYHVSVRTIVRWLEFYESYNPKTNFGSNKLTLQKAREIRELHAAGVPMKNLAKKYQVTFSTISRVIHNITHKDCKHETSEVSVIYNPH